MTLREFHPPCPRQRELLEFEEYEDQAKLYGKAVEHLAQDS